MRQFALISCRSPIYILLVLVLFVQLGHHVEPIKADESSDSSSSTVQPAAPEDSSPSTLAPTLLFNKSASDDGSHHEQGSTGSPRAPSDDSRSGLDVLKSGEPSSDLRKTCSQHASLLGKCCKISIDDILGGKTSQQCLKANRILAMCCECCASSKMKSALIQDRGSEVQLLSRCVFQIVVNVLTFNNAIPETCCKIPILKLLCRNDTPIIPIVTTSRPRSTMQPRSTKKPRSTKRPRSTMTPRTTKKPRSTMQPMSSTKPKSTTKPKTSRRPRGTTTTTTTTTTKKPEDDKEDDKDDDKGDDKDDDKGDDKDEEEER